jgi:hypothetical protein
MSLSTVLKPFKFLLPLALWCYCYRGFLWGNLRVSEDTFAIYAVVKYFLSHITMGVFPQWNTFLDWGMAHICQIGEFNPIWLVTLVLDWLGLDIYHGFLWSMVLYFFIGGLGVYNLLVRITADKFLSYLGFVLFLFSGAGMTLFTQLTFIFIFVPSVWFFYFLADFYKTSRVSSVLCLAFTLMLIATTYIPFYFLTVFLCMFLLSVVLYGNIIKEIILKSAAFIRQNPKVFILAVIGLSAALLVSFLNWFFLRTDFLVLARPAVMTYDIVRDSGIPISEILREPSLFFVLLQVIRVEYLDYARDIFSLKSFQFDNQRIFYIPVLAHLLLFVAMVGHLTKRHIFFGVFCFFLFLIAMARLTPVYELLFTYVPFFHIFRNIFFLIPFIISLYLIFTLDVFQSFWADAERRNLWRGLWAVLVLGGFLLVWCRPGQSMWSTYAAAAGLLLLAVLRFTGVLDKNNKFLKASLIVLAVLEPTQVFSYHTAAFKNMDETTSVTEGTRTPLTKPKFVYVRPVVNIDKDVQPNDIYRLYYWHINAMQDAANFMTFKYGYPTYWSHALAKYTEKMPMFNEYMRRKFAVYNNFDAEHPYETPQAFINNFKAPDAFIQEPVDALRVKSFDANHLTMTTRFPGRKFLVYNDSYHPFWKAYINGKQVPLYRANYAFKGIWVPDGEAQVRFVFSPPGNSTVYIIILIFFYLYVFICIKALWRERLR